MSKHKTAVHDRMQSGAQLPGVMRGWGLLALVVGGVVVAFVAITILGSGRNGGSTNLAGKSGSASGLRIGGPAPDFRALDVVSGKTMTLDDLEGRNTLLFFSEGASCQACLVQIRDLEKARAALRARDVRLVSVTTDPPDVLASTARQYRITTPLLSDGSTRMSADYGMLGKGGMGHPQTDGHAFMLLDRAGRIMWARAYAEMYVPPKDLLAALP